MKKKKKEESTGGKDPGPLSGIWVWGLPVGGEEKGEKNESKEKALQKKKKPCTKNREALGGEKPHTGTK